MDLLIILTFDLIFMINCITLHCYDRNFFLDCQFCVLLYPLFIWLCDFKTASKGHSICNNWFVWWMVVVHVVLKGTGMFLHLVIYFIVFWLMRLCILVHFQMYLGGHSLISICWSCFVEFISSVMENLSTSKEKIVLNSPNLSPHTWTLVKKE